MTPELNYFSALRHKDCPPTKARTPSPSAASTASTRLQAKDPLWAVWPKGSSAECDFITAGTYYEAVEYGQEVLHIPDDILQVRLVAHSFEGLLHPIPKLEWSPLITHVEGARHEDAPERARLGCLYLRVEWDDDDDPDVEYEDARAWTWVVEGATTKEGFATTKDGAKSAAELVAKKWLYATLGAFPAR